jgi:hypothetical protein
MDASELVEVTDEPVKFAAMASTVFARRGLVGYPTPAGELAMDEGRTLDREASDEDPATDEGRTLDRGSREALEEGEGKWAMLGRLMRFALGVVFKPEIESDIDASEGPGSSTDIPVMFGERGEATMGAGIVRRLRYVGVLCSRTSAAVCGGGWCRLSVDRWNAARPYVPCVARASDRPLAAVSEDPLAGVLGAGARAVSFDGGISALARSSHFPLTASRLAPTR